jgi:hypothetical protein
MNEKQVYKVSLYQKNWLKEIIGEEKYKDLMDAKNWTEDKKNTFKKWIDEKIFFSVFEKNMRLLNIFNTYYQIYLEATNEKTTDD